MEINKGAVAEGVFKAIGEIEVVKRKLNAQNALLSAEINRLTRKMNNNFRHIATLDCVMNTAAGELREVIFGETPAEETPAEEQVRFYAVEWDAGKFDATRVPKVFHTWEGRQEYGRACGRRFEAITKSEYQSYMDR